MCALLEKGALLEDAGAIVHAHPIQSKAIGEPSGLSGTPFKSERRGRNRLEPEPQTVSAARPPESGARAAYRRANAEPAINCSGWKSIRGRRITPRAGLAVRRDGFRGMMAIHPCQVAAINLAFSPDESELAEARRVVALFEDQVGAGVASLDGRMLDAPILLRLGAS